MDGKREIKVLIVDDSAYNRMTLGDILSGEPDIRVVGKACDGEEALAMAQKERPDVITLDLEMPKMGGFPFLRILMSKLPTPVLVISSHAEPEKVFRALELGALDFVAKPTKTISPAILQIAEEIVSKVRALGRLDRPIDSSLRKDEERTSDRPVFSRPPSDAVDQGRPRVVAIAASTGGPKALSSVLAELPEDLPASILVVQHMPPRFTTNFAERLDRLCRLRVVEPLETSPLLKGTVYISPGDRCIELGLAAFELVVRVLPPTGREKAVPSADRLFSSVARTVGADALGIVLTGMGSDGCQGALELAAAGAMVVAEDESTAVVPGMPAAAVAAGAVQYVAPIYLVASYIADFCRAEG